MFRSVSPSNAAFTINEAVPIVAGLRIPLPNMNIFQSAQPSLLDRAWLAIRYPYDLVRNPVDALLSIPALSFLLIPTFSSYSTSLNLLFFYVTWSTLILSNSPLKVEVLGTLGIRILFYLLPAAAFLLFDSATPNIAAKAKEHGEAALPMGEEQGGRKGRWWRTALVSTGNVLLGVVLQSAVELVFTKLLHIRSALKISTTLPMPWAIAVDLIRGLFLREVRLFPPSLASWVTLIFVLDLELCPTSLRSPSSQLAAYGLSHHLAAYYHRSVCFCCELRPSFGLRCPRFSADILARLAVPPPSFDLSHVPCNRLSGRSIRLQRLQYVTKWVDPWWYRKAARETSDGRGQRKLQLPRDYGFRCGNIAGPGCY